MEWRRFVTYLSNDPRSTTTATITITKCNVVQASG